MKPLTSVFLLVLLCCMFETNEAWGRRRRRRAPPPRVNCAVSGWGEWGQCSQSCGEGVMTRSRKITRHPMHGGAACHTLKSSASCTVRPCPVFSCSWTAWGNWSECNSCSSERSRFRNVSVAAMFGGETCVGRDYQIDRGCPQDKPCTTTCPEGYFSCADGITCINSNLRCNDDDDCTDNSDELDCGSKITSPCADNQYSHIPNIGLAGAGFDITEGKVAGQILDNNRFNGRCILIRSGDHMTVFRKPANVQYYGFQVNVDSSFSTSAYNSAEQYVEEEKRRTDDKINTGSSVGFPGFGRVSVQSSFTKNSNMRKIVKQSSNKDAKFFRISSTVKLAQFSIVRGNYILSHNFRRRLRNLPEHYDYLKYLQVIIDFGTHFCSAGTLGGKYEYIYRYSKSQLKKSKLSDSEQRHCLSMEASAKFFGSGVSGGSTSCSSNALSQSHGSSFTKSAEDVISNVIGGYSGKAASLSFSNDPNDNDYDAWVETVKHNPSIIDYEITPMSAVITNPTKRRNMERALYLYMAKYDVVACKGKCYNGAAKIVTDNGKTCTCLCKFPYTGVDCHNE